MPTKVQSESASKKVTVEAQKLQVSPIVDFYEIDTRDIQFDLALIEQIDSSQGFNDGIFRFHNHVNLYTREIIFGGQTYYASPIMVSDMERSSRGTLPRPKISIITDFEGERALTELRSTLRKIGDLTGAKFTRIRTFMKFIDAGNNANLLAQIPNHDPDPNAVLQKDVYFIDRKSTETSRALEFELASSIDLENAFTPKRPVVQNRCQWKYRGEGCCYSKNLVKDTHGVSNSDPEAIAFKNLHFKNSDARPVATFSDELIFSSSPLANDGVLGYGLYEDQGEWNKNFGIYRVGHGVYIRKGDLEYHFVCKAEHQSSVTNSPPNLNFWISDQCSRSVNGCKLRFRGVLPYGGFPAATKVPAS